MFRRVQETEWKKHSEISLLMNIVGNIWDHVSTQINRIYNKYLTAVFADMLHIIA